MSKPSLAGWAESMLCHGSAPNQLEASTSPKYCPAAHHLPIARDQHLRPLQSNFFGRREKGIYLTAPDGVLECSPKLSWLSLMFSVRAGQMLSQDLRVSINRLEQRLKFFSGDPHLALSHQGPTPRGICAVTNWGFPAHADESELCLTIIIIKNSSFM